jgi:hypothetical protein
MIYTGLYLTSADAGKKELTVLGPSGLSQFFKSTHHFMMRSDLTLDIKEYDSEIKVLEYPDMNLHVIPINNNHPISNKNVKIQTQICYICEIPETLGKFDLKKAITLGIPKGNIDKTK